ncbi:MAG: hypothetical protein ABJH04_09940 [Cyclobacteriaceae bacterium]
MAIHTVASYFYKVLMQLSGLLNYVRMVTPLTEIIPPWYGNNSWGIATF